MNERTIWLHKILFSQLWIFVLKLYNNHTLMELNYPLCANKSDSICTFDLMKRLNIYQVNQFQSVQVWCKWFLIISKHPGHFGYCLCLWCFSVLWDVFVSKSMLWGSQVQWLSYTIALTLVGKTKWLQLSNHLYLYFWLSNIFEDWYNLRLDNFSLSDFFKPLNRLSSLPLEFSILFQLSL